MKDRADDFDMRIDHWHPRTAGGEHFQWNNLIGSCTHRGSCDDRKGETPLFLHPFRGNGPDPREFLRYHGDGSIQADDPRAAADVATLGLNARHLQRDRRSAADVLNRKLRNKGFSLKSLRDQLRAHEALAGTAAPEYASVLAYMLRRWLRKHGAEPQR